MGMRGDFQNIILHELVCHSSSCDGSHWERKQKIVRTLLNNIVSTLTLDNVSDDAKTELCKYMILSFYANLKLYDK